MTIELSPSQLGKYRTICVDPPWEISKRMGAGGRRARSTEVPYDFLTVEEIKALPVAGLAADECHLYLWCTRRLFREGVACAVARAWGFEPVGELIWGLRNPGMGGFCGNGHEPILLASRGGGVLADQRASGERRVLASAVRAGQDSLGQARGVPRSGRARQPWPVRRAVRPTRPVRLVVPDRRSGARRRCG